ncbi:PBS lyase [Streptomyces sp. NBC_01142]|uniref:HEAT repeat domain-containing protein n=1 Tax=Streptomyces sp. NBC_01142 TaxID=2975865 RepID=UPI00225050BD|nr:HEAT repeat domain-containing protein [Streptomyces sp. NBC_01142]MCX4819370.1 PBS lyase [Streptomyces sp. NBC_01142]
MFGGIDEVDWASLRHAYGPADDVPEMLRGLASADPAERETALDGMYGAVHHQGDVYDSTLACIPFLLELVANPALQDRGGIVELLTSIGGIDLDGDDELDPEDEEFVYAANYAMAASAVTAGADVFLGLVGAEDRGVRLAVPLALATLHDDPALVLGLLRERLGTGPRSEPDAEVRFTWVEAAGRIALRHRSLAPEVVEWLSGLTRVPYSAGLRLAALAQLARCAPDALPADVVPGVTGLLRELRAGPVAPPPPAERPSTPTLVGRLRELHEADTAGRGAPWTADLLRTLHSGLGDRVDDRIALLADQLCSPDWGQRIDAVRMSSGLLGTWRGAYEELVGLIGEQLADPEPRLADAAAATLEELFGLAAPAADALADRVAADPGAWVREWASGPPSLGSAISALARAGDRRAVPVLARALERDEAPHDLGYALGHLGAAAAPLAPALRRRLGETELDDRLYDRAGPLLYGLAALRAAEAVPEVLRVLRGAPEYRREWVIESVLRALTAFGPAAREAIPDLRMLLRDCGSDAGFGAGVYFDPGTGFGSGSGSGSSASLAARTAGALWAIEGDAGAVLPVLRTALGASDSGARRTAATALGSLGAAGADAAPALRELLRAAEPWTRVDAAIALLRVTGDPERAWPVLHAAWEEMPYTRVQTAECLAGLKTDAAQLLLRGELASVRRHNAIDGGYGSHDIFTDEKLLALCRQALTREGPKA